MAVVLDEDPAELPWVPPLESEGLGELGPVKVCFASDGAPTWMRELLPLLKDALPCSFAEHVLATGEETPTMAQVALVLK